MTPVGVTTVRELRPGNKINVGEAIATVSKALAVFRPADSSMSPQGAVKRSLTFNPKRNGILFSGDYFYGIYLYGFPIQQAVTAITGSHRNWYLDLCFVLPGVFAVAELSWWFIE